ncbi:hypothetical protein HYDPIDRAFT_177683 [Hydnomerulius pinastri MD-312]|uniref:Ras modification protein ERF4 n=1 Tax=Hydnomerulius pinastri MD-312 TaxID=994086 RepID=A0A0C9W1L8_9AGAM|nr:hypothetical protein HYDPIDRAFT_177683 [Hydnomerulius pinastri MD-312]
MRMSESPNPTPAPDANDRRRKQAKEKDSDTQSTTGSAPGDAPKKERRKRQRRPKDDQLPPSPPLTRTGTNGSTGHEAEGAPPIQVEEVEDVEEADIVQGWHPLAHEGSRSRDEDEEDSGSVHLREDSIQDDQGSEVDEIPRRLKESPRVEHLRMEFKAPSPQPWDLVDPLPDNIDPLTSDYYSTLQSKNFATLQKNRRRPLIPHSSYYFGPPQPDAAYGTPPVGQIGVHHPREIVRIERDYAGGELIQFSPIYPLELEGRITATQFLEMINDINEILISAHSIRHSFLFNFLAVFTLQLSTLVLTSHYTKEMRRLEQKIEELNTQIYNPVGLNILSPRKVAFLFLEIEYYGAATTFAEDTEHTWVEPDLKAEVPLGRRPRGRTLG